jgi:anti-sigma regulatory factor (Ser/Thr protein kinase)
MPSDRNGALTELGQATLRCRPQAAGQARMLVAGWLVGPAHAALRDDACLLVSELVTNSVVHAGQPNGAPLRIRATATNGVVRVHVEDLGSGPVRSRAADGSAGGFGLHLVDVLATRWGVTHDRGTQVWFELDAGRAGS